jgi:hypothetical protein
MLVSDSSKHSLERGKIPSSHSVRLSELRFQKERRRHIKPKPMGKLHFKWMQKSITTKKLQEHSETSMP